MVTPLDKPALPQERKEEESYHSMPSAGRPFSWEAAIALIDWPEAKTSRSVMQTGSRIQANLFKDPLLKTERDICVTIAGGDPRIESTSGAAEATSGGATTFRIAADGATDAPPAWDRSSPVIFWVRLTGNVHSNDEIQTAERLARQVNDVREVYNDLALLPGPPAPTTTRWFKILLPNAHIPSYCHGREVTAIMAQ
jgi:hypothetical protein